MKIKHYIFAILLSFLIVACGKQQPTLTPMFIPSPEPGKVTVVGKLFSTTSQQPLPATAVWLAEVVRQGEQGAYILDAGSSPGVYANEDGTFVMPNVFPGEYVIVVGDPESQHEIISELSGDAKTSNITADQIYDVGELRVKLTK